MLYANESRLSTSGVSQLMISVGTKLGKSSGRQLDAVDMAIFTADKYILLYHDNVSQRCSGVLIKNNSSSCGIVCINSCAASTVDYYL